MWNHNEVKIKRVKIMIKWDNFLKKVYRTMCISHWDTVEKAINIQYKKNK